MILFYFQFLLTNIIFSLIICAALMRLNNNNGFSGLELFLYSLGLGPVLTSLLLYYFLLFVPGKSDLIYLVFVMIVYLGLWLVGRKSFETLWIEFTKKVKSVIKELKALKPHKKIEPIAFYTAVILLLLTFLSLYLTNTVQRPLSETDALKYGTLGRILYEEKSMEYRWIRTYPKTGFYSTINQAPSFSLLLTWEKILNGFFGADNDLYFKSVSAYYALLILLVFTFWLSKKNKYLALLGMFSLLSGVSFFHTLIQQHLDSYRAFFLIISWIFLGFSVERRNTFHILAFGIFSGFATFAHTIGAVLVVFNCLAFLIFLKGSLKYKLRTTSAAVILIILCGWFHYILDVFWGFGWLIFDRQVTWWG